MLSAALAPYPSHWRITHDLGRVEHLHGDTLINNGMLSLTGRATSGRAGRLRLPSGATLDVSGRIDGALTLGGDHTLTGSGTVNAVCCSPQAAPWLLAQAASVGS